MSKPTTITKSEARTLWFLLLLAFITGMGLGAAIMRWSYGEI